MDFEALTPGYRSLGAILNGRHEHVAVNAGKFDRRVARKHAL